MATEKEIQAVLGKEKGTKIFIALQKHSDI
jgi:t-SNARE complex subunit (syntaxin)